MFMFIVSRGQVFMFQGCIGIQQMKFDDNKCLQLQDIGVLVVTEI